MMERSFHLEHSHIKYMPKFYHKHNHSFLIYRLDDKIFREDLYHSSPDMNTDKLCTLFINAAKRVSNNVERWIQMSEMERSNVEPR